MENKDWDLAVQLRGRSFMRNLETFKSLSKNIPKNVDTSNGRNLAVINVGAPCCGVNAAGNKGAIIELGPKNLWTGNVLPFSLGFSFIFALKKMKLKTKQPFL